MHVMFIHPNFPSQFGHIANYLATQLKWQCTFVTSIDTKHLQLPFTHINYKVREGPQPKTFYNPNTLQELIDHMTAIYGGMRGVPQIQPDLVVGHMSYGSLLYLRNLYKCPFVGYYELLPPAFWGEGLVLRPEYPPTENVRLFNATYHALTYLHLHAVEAAYTPTHYQLSTAPAELRYKIRVIFDGVDLQFFRRRPYASVSPPSELPPGVPWLQPRPTSFRGHAIGPNTRIVTYVSRGLESMRGFDIFMQTAKRIYEQYDDVIFLIAGEERTNYGHDNHYLPKGQTFKQFVLEQDEYDLSRFFFLGRIPTDQLVELYSLSDLHIYLTRPYVLSWSLMQAMATECTILASATAPVEEVIDHEVHGLLVDFYDVEGLAEQAVKVLRDPGKHRPLAAAAWKRIREKYGLQHCVDQLVQLFEETVARGPMTV